MTDTSAPARRAGRRLVLVTVSLLLMALSGCDSAAGQQPSDSAPRSVILISGDGMAAAHREAGRLNLVGLDQKLQMDQLPVTGLMTTDSRDPKTAVTDSAAAASAWSTGQKTYNGAVSVDVQGETLPILGERAKAHGKATGLVTTSEVTDASPAAFFAQNENRENQGDIARQYIEESKPDVILGGGEDYWYPTGEAGEYSDPDGPQGSRSTSGNLVDRAKRQGYAYASTPEQLKAARGEKLLGLFANEQLYEHRREGQGDSYSPVVSLSELTAKALDVLDQNDKGFFLFVEEEAVDGFAHDNNGAKMLTAMAALDQAVGVARDYVERHPDTLLIVTGDHECGGLTVEEDSGSDESGSGLSAEDGPFPIKDSDRKFVLDWSTNGHTGTPVPVSAQGPAAEKLMGTYANTHLHTVMSGILG